MAYSLKVKYTAHNSKVTGSIPVKPRIKMYPEKIAQLVEY